MAKPKIKIDHAGVAAFMKSAGVASAIGALAQAVASNVSAPVESGASRGGDGGTAPVVVDRYTTDRAAASVTIAHPAGLGLQAKHGTLTKAATAAGLEVTAE